MEKLYTKREVMDILGVSLATLNRYLALGKISFIKLDGVSGTVRFKREAIEKFLNDCTKNTNGGEND